MSGRCFSGVSSSGLGRLRRALAALLDGFSGFGLGCCGSGAGGMGGWGWGRGWNIDILPCLISLCLCLCLCMCVTFSCLFLPLLLLYLCRIDLKRVRSSVYAFWTSGADLGVLRSLEMGMRGVEEEEKSGDIPYSCLTQRVGGREPTSPNAMSIITYSSFHWLWLPMTGNQRGTLDYVINAEKKRTKSLQSHFQFP